MPTFVVTLRLPDAFNEEFIAIIPRHRDFINRLLNEKIVESYAISSDRSRGWVTMNGEDTAAVQALVEQFPLYRFLRGVEIDELFIFDSTASRFPHINLN
ncbi:YciI family protein [Hymenobacter ruber]